MVRTRVSLTLENTSMTDFLDLEKTPSRPVIPVDYEQISRLDQNTEKSDNQTRAKNLFITTFNRC